MDKFDYFIMGVAFVFGYSANSVATKSSVSRQERKVDMLLKHLKVQDHQEEK